MVCSLQLVQQWMYSCNTKFQLQVLKIMAWSAVEVREWVRTHVNPALWQRNSFNFRGKNRDRESSYYANVLMFYLEGEKWSLSILSGSCDKTLKRKRMFLFSFCTFHWLYLNVILYTKRYYAWYGAKHAIWPLFLRLFMAFYFEFYQPWDIYKDFLREHFGAVQLLVQWI